MKRTKKNSKNQEGKTMKNLFSYFALIAGAAVLTGACSKDNTTDPMAPKYRMATISFQASADNDTRTTVDAENNKLVWAADKESELSIAAIELWDDEIEWGVTNSLPTNRVGKGDCASVNNGNAKFTAQVATKDETDYKRGYLAVYPHEAFSSMWGATIRVNLPAQQKPSAVGDIDPNATLLFASDLSGYDTTPETLPLFFRHIAAYGAITVKNLKKGFGNLSQITITSNETGKKLSGEWMFNYTIDDINGSKGSNRDSDNSITLNVGHLNTEAATTEGGIRFYFSALPCGSLSDFTFTAVTDEGYKFTKTVSGSGTLDFNRAKREVFAVNFSGINPESPDQLTIGNGWASESDKESGGVNKLWDGTLDSKPFFPTSDYGLYHSFYSGATFPVTIVLQLTNAAKRIDYIDFYTRSTGTPQYPKPNGLPGKFDVYYMECTENRTTADSSWQPAVKSKGGASNPMFDMNMEVYNPTPFRMDFIDEPLENVGWVKFVFYSGWTNESAKTGFITGEEIQLFGLNNPSRWTPAVQSNWTEDLHIVSGTASSYQPGLGVDLLFDGVILQSENGNGIYHSNYNEKDLFPIELTFKLEKPSRVDQVVYYTRPTVAPGHPKKFDVYYRYSTSPEGTFYSLNGTYGEEATALFEVGQYSAYLSGYRANLPYVLDDVIEIKLRFYPTSSGYLSGNEVQIKGVTIK